ncbi:ATP-binding protein [Janthinobacterium sp. SUN073]|uniref:PAS domain-containing hybrid sensor histidine kinase/response regulator n=1 Tax=Janthinobacterium sp. SUN073 TaxID=3004102 RepID=UPI0025AFF2BB|nr:ATP-binding protein [Janthinobacterium sp. SUN073]MDN2699295.1 ATP-binding protein [Janthinobacterium sp. SUN073]
MTLAVNSTPAEVTPLEKNHTGNVEIELLHEEVNALCLQLGKPARYPVYTTGTIKPGSYEQSALLGPGAATTSASLLAESEKRYRTLFDLSPVAVYVVDDAGIIRDFNMHAAELWGKVPVRGDTDQLFCGAHKLFRADGSFMPHDRTPMAAIIEGKLDEVRDTEVIIERPDGSRITVIVNIVPLRSADGHTIGAINCFYDITERSRMEAEIRTQTQELAELHHRKDEFLAMLSHELRNPLAPITSAMQLLRFNQDETPVQRKAYDVIERQTGQLVHLVNELMEISRINSGKIRLEKRDILINEVVTRAVETTQPLVTERLHELKIILPQEALWLHADADRIEQVLINLISNAAKYTAPGGNISITVEEWGSIAQLRVRDSGIGIPPELLPHVFDLFTQAYRSLDLSRGGLGIGLCLVKRLVELHGGSVSATSVLGIGSEFIVSLPTSPAPIKHMTTDLSEIQHRRNTSRRVMVVDDNKDAADTQAELLEAYEYEVRVIYDGIAILKEMMAYRPHVVLLDIGLPGLNGYEIARLIRQQAVFDDVTLIAVTGYGSEADQLKAREAGFNYHLPKPTNFSLLQEMMRVRDSSLVQGG